MFRFDLLAPTSHWTDFSSMALFWQRQWDVPSLAVTLCLVVIDQGSVLREIHIWAGNPPPGKKSGTVGGQWEKHEGAYPSR